MVIASASWLNLPAFQMMALGSVCKTNSLNSCGLENLDVVRLPAAQMLGAPVSSNPLSCEPRHTSKPWPHYRREPEMLTGLELGNFKCFESLQLHLAPLTILCGVNGAGKSSVIQALLLLHQSQITGDSNSLVLGGNFIDLGTGHDILFEEATSETIQFSLQHSDLSESLWLGYECIKNGSRLDPIRVNSKLIHNDSRFHIQSTSRERLLRTIRQWEHLPPLGGRLHYVSADRTDSRRLHPHSEVMVRLDDMNTRRPCILNYLANFQNTVMQTGDPRCEHTSSRQTFSVVEHWFQRVSASACLRLESLTDDDASIAGFSFARHKDIETRQYRPTNVGFGLSQVIPVLVALLEPPKALCMIENPEAHLHPRGQTRLAELAVRASLAGLQVIVETHSDHFLDGVRIAVRDGVLAPDKIAIHHFQRTGTRTEVSSPTIAVSGRLSFWPEGFFDQHEENLSRLLGPRT